MSSVNGQLWLIATPYGQLFGKVQISCDDVPPDHPDCKQVTLLEPLVTDGVNAGPYPTGKVTIRYGHDCLLATHLLPTSKMAKQHGQIIQSEKLKASGLVGPDGKPPN